MRCVRRCAQNIGEMTSRLCPACQQVNSAELWRCSACGFGLGDDDTVPGALLRLGDKPQAGHGQDSTGALWLEDLEPPTLTQTLDGPDGEPFSITLRQLEVPAAPPKTLVSRRAAARMSEPDLPRNPREPIGLVASDPEPRPPVGPSPASLKVRAQLSGDPASRAEAKAAKRAAVRRARIGQAAAGAADMAEPGVPEVLVLDADAAARSTLGTLLGGFGFLVHAVSGTEEAAALAASRGFVAAFVDVALDGADGGAGLELCQQIKQGSASPPGDAVALVLVAARLRQMERVRAKLAGCDAFLTKPVGRGDVARALEACGVALPSDARKR